MSTKQALEVSRLTEPTIREEVDSLGDGIMDVVNLFEEDTGIEGIVFVSTRMASHGPRVKYLQRAGEDQKSFSVSVTDYPEVLAASLPERVVNRMAPSVIAWVQLNKLDLLRLWNDGNRLSKRDLVELLDGLKRLP